MTFHVICGAVLAFLLLGSTLAQDDDNSGEIPNECRGDPCFTNETNKVCDVREGRLVCDCAPGFELHFLNCEPEEPTCPDGYVYTPRGCKLVESEEVDVPSGVSFSEKNDDGCEPGFFRNEQGWCEDFNECEEDEPCGELRVCHNTYGAFYCTDSRSHVSKDGRCPKGYKKKNGRCIMKMTAREELKNTDISDDEREPNRVIDLHKNKVKKSKDARSESNTRQGNGQKPGKKNSKTKVAGSKHNTRQRGEQKKGKQKSKTYEAPSESNTRRAERQNQGKKNSRTKDTQSKSNTRDGQRQRPHNSERHGQRQRPHNSERHGQRQKPQISGQRQKGSRMTAMALCRKYRQNPKQKTFYIPDPNDVTCRRYAMCHVSTKKDSFRGCKKNQVFNTATNECAPRGSVLCPN